MALRLSTALRNFMNRDGSLKRAMHGGVIKIYSGAQPANADAAVTGTLLATITDASLAHTNEVLSAGSVTLTGGAAGSIDTLTVNSVSIIDAAVPFNTSLNQTAADLAAKINSSLSTPEYSANASGAVVTIKASPGTGTGPNGFVVASTTTTLTKTDANMAGGVAAVNGLKLGSSLAGVIEKVAGQTWSGVGAAAGTAGWFRFCAAVADAGGLDSNAEYIRIDGAISTAGAQINMTNTSISVSATQTVSDFALTLPSA
jgi:hypothetical protein